MQAELENLKSRLGTLESHSATTTTSFSTMLESVRSLLKDIFIIGTLFQVECTVGILTAITV